MEALAGALLINKQLIKLDLGLNSISDVGVRRLTNSLLTNRNLSTLYLDFNDITDAGAVNIGGMLQVNPRVPRLCPP